MVFIMPGMENFAPERTLTSSGFSGSPSFLPICAFELGQRREHLLVDLGEYLVAVLEIDVADFGGDREAGRHGHAGPAHLGEPGALAAEDLLHLAVAVGCAAAKAVNVGLHDYFWSPEVTISEKSAIVENLRSNSVEKFQAVAPERSDSGRIHHHFVEERHAGPRVRGRSSVTR